MTQRAEIRRAEGLHAKRGGFRHIARRLNFIIQQHQRAQAPRARISRDTNGIDDIHRPITGKRGCRALRANQHHGNRDFQRERKEIGGFLKACRAMGNDNAGKFRIFRRKPMAKPKQFLPFRPGQLRGGNGAEGHWHNIRDQRCLGDARQQPIHIQDCAIGEIIQDIERACAHGGNRAPRANHGNAGLHAATFGAAALSRSIR